MSIIETHNYNADVTRLPVFVRALGERRHEATVFLGRKRERESDGLMSHPERPQTTPVTQVPPNAAAALAGLDRRTLKNLESAFGKLSDTEVASVISLSKLLDAVRLGDKRKLEEHLAYLRLSGPTGANPRAAAFWERLADEMRPTLLRPTSKDDDLMPLAWATILFAPVCAHVQMVVWTSFEHRLSAPRLGVLAPNLMVALGLQLIMAAQGSTGLSHCVRCGQGYIRTKHDQRFCSFRCGSRERQARYRATLKGERG